MKIAVLGTGNVGAALGKAWAGKGHEIVYGSREPKSQKVQTVVKATTGGAPASGTSQGKAHATTMREAAQAGEVVLLATPWSATQAVLKAAGSLAGKVVVDAVNPLKPGLAGLAIGHSHSAAEDIAKWAPGAKVVKAFNHIGAGVMANPRFGTHAATLFICGDDDAAKKTVTRLAEEIGFEVVDAGALAQARLLEPLAMLWVSLAYGRGLGPEIAFRLVRRGK